MSNLSIRAFDESQRRKLYADRRGSTGIACMLRDIAIAQKHLSIISEIIWSTGMGGSPRQQREMKFPMELGKTDLYEQFGIIAIQLLQLSGALGIDFLSLAKSEIERQELTVL